MNKLIMTIAIVVLPQLAIGKEKNTLERAQEVAQRMRDAADREYAKGVARRTGRRQWPDAAAALKRVKAKHELIGQIHGNAKAHYDHFRLRYGWCWWNPGCVAAKRAAKHWGGLLDGINPNMELSKSAIKPNGVPMADELARAKEHLALTKEEEYQAQLVKWIVDSSFDIDVYKRLAALTFRSARWDVANAKAAVSRASKRVAAAVPDEVLQKTRQAKYDKADLYLRQQRVIHEAEQARIAKEQARMAKEQARMAKEQARRQALTDKEDKFFYLMIELLYGDDLWKILWHI
jgi:type II secretory pathway pseudopilin PulG